MTKSLTESDIEFDYRIEQSLTRMKRIGRIVNEVFQLGVHFGSVTGKEDGRKPSLLKPGADDACTILGLVADFEPQMINGDGVDSPSISVISRCDLHEGDLNGPIVGVGYGAGNTFEKKFRYRNAGNQPCPNCRKVKVGKSKAEYGGGWVCWECKSKWSDADGTTLFGSARLENEDPHDLQNNLVKYSNKRAHLDAVLRIGFSAYFGQDLEDIVGHSNTSLPDAGGSIPTNADLSWLSAPAGVPIVAQAAPVIPDVPKPLTSSFNLEADTPGVVAPDWTGDVQQDIGLALDFLSMRLDKAPKEILWDASSFKGDKGDLVGITPQTLSRHAGGKWGKSTLTRLKATIGELSLAGVVAPGALPF